LAGDKASPWSIHTNLLQKSYGLLATHDSLSSTSFASVDECSEAGRFGAEQCHGVTEQFSRFSVLMIMNATNLSFRWIDCDRNQVLPVVPGNHKPNLGIGVNPRDRHCPSCDSIVYSRRHRLCGVCGQMLPEACLFTATEAESVEMLLRTERQRHKAWLKRTTAM